MFRLVVFDDRRPEQSIHTERCFSKENGIEEGHSYIRTMYQDPDDGVIPTHLQVRVETVRYITEVYDDAYPKEIRSSFESEKELAVIHEAMQALKILRGGPVLPVGRYTFRLKTEWRKC